MPALLYIDDLVLCGESEEDLRATVKRFINVCRRSLKVSTCKSKVTVMNGEEELEYEFRVDRMRVELVSEFKNLGCILNQVQMRQTDVGRWRVGRYLSELLCL